MRGMWIAVGVVMALGLSATAAQAKLEGQFRETFVTSSERTCLAKQKGDPVNAQISENLLAAYCTCYSARVADNLSADQLILAVGDINRGNPPPWLAGLAKEASTYCIANLKDYVKSN